MLHRVKSWFEVRVLTLIPRDCILLSVRQLCAYLTFTCCDQSNVWRFQFEVTAFLPLLLNIIN